MGEKGRIYLNTDDPEVDLYGRILENDMEVGQIKVMSFKSPTGLLTIGQSVLSA